MIPYLSPDVTNSANLIELKLEVLFGELRLTLRQNTQVLNYLDQWLRAVIQNELPRTTTQVEISEIDALNNSLAVELFVWLEIGGQLESLSAQQLNFLHVYLRRPFFPKLFDQPFEVRSKLS